jgi:phage terminase small subunit
MTAHLRPRQQRFITEYLVDLNAKRAAIRAGYSAHTAEVQGPRLLRNVQVKGAVDDAIAAQSARVEVSADWVIKRLMCIAGADPNELIRHERRPCHQCYGVAEDGHQLGKSLRNPDPMCPRCNGEGSGTIVIGDTTKLSPNAAALYAGVKTTKDGIEIKMHDQMAALEKLGRHLGLFDPKAAVGSTDNPFRMLIDSVQGHAFPVVQHPPSFDEDDDNLIGASRPPA